MDNRFDLMQWKTRNPVGEYSWVGNLRWFVKETDTPGSYRFCTFPISRKAEEAATNGNASAHRTFFQMQMDAEWTDICYRADGFQLTGDLGAELVLPWERYGGIWRFRNVKRGSVQFSHAGIAEAGAGRTVCIFSAPYYVVLRCSNADFTVSDQKIVLEPREDTVISMAFHVDRDKAQEEAVILCDQAEGEIRSSRAFWERYLDSCPVAEMEQGYRCTDPLTGEAEFYDSDRILKRQLWYWWCALMNVSKLDFNREPLFVSPDKFNWDGTWSNDGPETMAALSLTNMAPLARECIVAYLRSSMDAQGNLSWYTHYDGCGCLNEPGDVGKYSHGVPNIVHTVGFYVYHTGDKSILHEKVFDGCTLWALLKTYMTRLFATRDINGDGLIEWANLWETGWDDKIGPFFEVATLNAWMAAVVKDTESYQRFYEENSRPVTTVVEQVYALWALDAMAYMAGLLGDAKGETEYREQYGAIISAVEARLWNEDEKFYLDWDLKKNCHCTCKNADAFYFLYFAENHERKEHLRQAFHDREEFGQRYCPMSSKANPGFNQWGYWSGGHWPREMGYLGMAMDRAGFRQEAMDAVIRALCCKEGNIIPEVLNPISGERSTRITKMAYDVLNNIALLVLKGKCSWSLSKDRTDGS